MITNFVIGMLLQLLNFTTFTGVGHLNHISYNLFQVVPVVEGFKKYISGNKFGLGRSFGVNFWVWNNLGLGFVLDRGEAALQVLNQSSENFLLGPRYRF